MTHLERPGKPTLLVALCAIACAACTTSGTPSASSPGTPSSSAAPASATPPASAPPSDPTGFPTAAEAPATSVPQAPLPAGYPKDVKVSSLPGQVRNWFQMQGTNRAVQLAPGVWTALQDGAAVEDAVNAEVLDGFCSSIKAFERVYRGGRTYPGACW
ncbi:hypothetical protein [Amycolatopsis sp. NPDC003676]